MVYMTGAKVYTYPTPIDANYSHDYYLVNLIFILLSPSINSDTFSMDWEWKHLKCARSQEFRRRDLTTSARILFDNSMHDRSSFLASPNAGQITNYFCQKI